MINDVVVNLIIDGMDVGICFGDRIEEGMVVKWLINVIKECLFCLFYYVKKYGFFLFIDSF